MASESFANPVERYLDADRYAREVDVLFRQTPQLVAHTSQLAEPGDFLVHDAAGVPVLLMRGDDGRLRAFLNVCRHRGTRIVNDACGRGAKSLVCPYHAWKYSSRGDLVGIPQREGFADLDTTQLGLVQLPLAERYGFAWVVFTPGVELDIDAHLAGVAEDLESYDFSTHTVYDTRVIEKPVNWKLSLDLFLETYHIRSAHHETIWPLFMDNVGVFERLGPHQRTLFPKRSITELQDVDPESWDLRPHCNILYSLFPSTGILVQPDHAAVLNTFPVGIDRICVSAMTLIPQPADSDKARQYWDANVALFYRTIDEDFALGESIQRGLSSGANTHLNFGRYEQALGWFHETVNRAVDASR